MKNKIIGVLIVVGLALLLDQCTSAKRDDEGQITQSGDVSAFEIQVGDCFKEMPNLDSASLSSVEATPCNEAHSWQTFDDRSITSSSYDEDGVREQANVMCRESADSLVNNMSAIKLDAFKNASLSVLYPTYKSWTMRGDRTVSCLIGSDTDTYFSSVFD
jgi:hypothetical protein